ncbi:magnesium transporter MgtE N-terminal domain-containing protein [Desulfofundulus sp.]|uniref:magnesium transporter MgtE N-terminal domain-containing protein n=1 Tax=Desulfofundulus sp. TaxID=2282750 RepID=UPI003C76B9D2
MLQTPAPPTINGEEEPREFYISEIIGKKIYDHHRNPTGRIRDLVVHWNTGYPQVVGIKYARSTQIISIDQVSSIGPRGIVLQKSLKETETRPIAPHEVFVNRWLLDKQIVDVQGAKVVRVNDIKLRQKKEGNTLLVHLIAVDIGFRGLIRRLGLRWLSEMFSEQLLDWHHFKPLEARTANLQLVISRKDLAHLHPADIADIMEDLNRHAQAALLRNLDDKTAAETLAEMNPEARIHLLEAMDETEATALIQAMAPDEAADVLSNLSQSKSAEILKLMQPQEAIELKELMEYPEGTAGSLMTTEQVALPVSLTAQQAIDRLREMAPSAETIYYVYAVNETGQLLGVLSLRELIVAPPDTPLEQILRRNIVTLHPQDDYETVLNVTVKYNLLAVPVVDDGGKLLGIVTVDDVLEKLLADRKNRLNHIEKFSYLLLMRTFKSR